MTLGYHTLQYMKTQSEWAQQLEQLHRVSTMVTAAHDMQSALQTILDSAREITDAELGALGVPSAPGLPMAYFVTSGLPAGKQMPASHPPIGLGVLSVLLDEGSAVRIDNVAAHPYFEGWPKGHPHISSFLGVPIQINGTTMGNLYLANKQTGEGFTEEDQRLIEMLATHAAVVLQMMRYHEKTQELAVLNERESIARQLEDDVLQAMYGVGLLMKHLDLRNTDRAERDLGVIRETFDDAIERLRRHLTDLASHD
jgi:GAF domain-containing protein